MKVGILQFFGWPDRRAPIASVDIVLVGRSNERLTYGVTIHGTADAVADELLRLEADLPLRSLLLAPLSEETFHRFTHDVLPKPSPVG